MTFPFILLSISSWGMYLLFMALFIFFFFSTLREASNMTSAWRFPSGWISLFCWLGFFAGFWTSFIVRLGTSPTLPHHLTTFRNYSRRRVYVLFRRFGFVDHSSWRFMFLSCTIEKKKLSNSRAIDPPLKVIKKKKFFVPKKCLRKDSAVLLYALVTLPPFSSLPSPFCPHRRNVRIRLLHCMAGSKFRRDTEGMGLNVDFDWQEWEKDAWLVVRDRF